MSEFDATLKCGFDNWGDVNMDSTMLIWIAAAFLAGVGSTLAYTRAQRPKPKAAAPARPTADGLTADFRTTEQERQKIIKEYPDTYTLALAILLILGGFFVGIKLFGPGGLLIKQDTGYYANTFTDVLSIGVTVLLIDRLNRRRDERELQKQFVRDIRTKVPDVVRNALHQMREHKWLVGDAGILKGEHLAGVELQDADLHDANLCSAKMQDAILTKTNLKDANLSGVNLFQANLSDANLFGTNLRNATLIRANLSNADLQGVHVNDADMRRANLSGAIMRFTDLRGTNLENANLSNINADWQYVDMDKSTTLPDGTKWTPDTDITRFTDPNHPNFWPSPA